MNSKTGDDFYTEVEQDECNDINEEVSYNEIRIRYWLFGFSKKKDQLYLWLKGLYRPGILEELGKLGFYKRYDSKNNLMLVREQNNILVEVGVPIIQDVFYQYSVKN